MIVRIKCLSLSPCLTTILSIHCQNPQNNLWTHNDYLSCFFSSPYEIIINIMAIVMERTVTESIDDLVREAETLKTRLEEERAKFNDMECK